MKKVLIKKEGKAIGHAQITKDSFTVALDKGHEVVEQVLKPKETVAAFKKSAQALDSDAFIAFAFRAAFWRRSEYSFEVV